MKNSKWYLHRLSCMSAKEIMHRIKQVINSRVVFPITLPNTVSSHSLRAESMQPFIGYVSDVDRDKYISEADSICEGRYSFFDIKISDLNSQYNWNSDPKSKIQAPVISSHKINYRNEEIVGNIKYLWEPNRHLHLVRVAQAYCLTHNSIYIDYICSNINSWIDSCPFLKGPNWTSSLEAAIRLINWSISYQLIMQAKPDQTIFTNGFCHKWYRAICEHIVYITHNYSKYSSANNHLIGEAAGVYIALSTWDFGPKMDKIKNESKLILESNCQEQTYSDGFSKEQTSSYLHFVFDFLLYSAIAGYVNDDLFSSSYLDKLFQMCSFVDKYSNCNNEMPMIGDDDEGFVTSLFPSYKVNQFNFMKNIANHDFSTNNNERLKWLNSSFFEQISSAHSPKKPKNNASGYYILSSDDGKSDEIKMIVDCGDLGYESIAAHGHADSLSFVLSVNGDYVFIDPGTYSYHTDKKYRDYFRGTSAHNTLTVDDHNQSLIGGNFMWIEHANSTCLSYDCTQSSGFFSGSHNGYARLSDPVIHKRQITFEHCEYDIVDSIQCESEHTIKRYFHLAPGLQPDIDGNCVTVRLNGKSLYLNFITDTHLYTAFGDDITPLGWFSPSFHVKNPTYTIVAENTIVNNIDLRCSIGFG